MKALIDPIDREVLKSELIDKKFLRPTNKAGNKIYIVTAHDSPNVMREIGRLRELSFRAGGGGSGNEIDTDEYDFLEKPYKQLIVWDPDAEEIIGGYRFIFGPDVAVDEQGQPGFVMSHLFTFSQQFVTEFMPHTIELGRAFVQPDYQTTKMGLKSLFALDNLWDGLGALIHSIKGVKYFVGKVTVYKEYPVLCRELIYEYLYKHFPDKDGLVKPIDPVEVSKQSQKIAKTVLLDEKADADYKLLNKAIRAEGQNIPAMFNAYIGLTDTMRFFGTIKDDEWGSVYESGIMVTMDDLLETKKQRYIQPYIEYLRKMMDERKASRQAAREARGVQRVIRSKQRENKSIIRRKGGK